MARIGASVSLESAYRRLRGVEALLDSGATGAASLAAAASAEAKLLAFCFSAQNDSGEGADTAEVESDPRTLIFFQAIEQYREWLETTDQ